MSRKILITGASGQLGNAIYLHLNDHFDLTLTSKKIYPYDKKKNIQILNISNKEDVKKYLSLIQTDIIINCAAYTDVDKSENNKNKAHDVNVKGVQYLLRYSHKDTLFIHISSDYVFDGKSGPYAEHDATFPVNYYGKTKLEAENIIRGSHRNYIIFRSNANYSDNLNSKTNFFTWVLQSLRNNNQISVVTDQISNPTLVSNLANIIFKSIILNCEGIFNYGSSDYLSRYEFAMLIAKTFKLDHNLIIPVDTEYLYKNIISYTAKRPHFSGLKTDHIETYIDEPIFSTQYNLKTLKHSLGAK